jgi:hypothetical protein
MDSRGLPLRGHGKGLTHPRDVRLVARRELVRVWRCVAQVVARALDIQRRVNDTLEHPPAILDALDRAADSKAQRGVLHVLMQLGSAHRQRRAEEQLPLVIEAFARGVASRRRTIAVGPIVVAGSEHRRRLERVEKLQRADVDGIVAPRGSGFQIAIVDREREPLRVHIGDQVRHANGVLQRRIRNVPPQSNLVRPTVAVPGVAGCHDPAGAVHQRGGDERRRQNSHHCDERRPLGRAPDKALLVPYAHWLLRIRYEHARVTTM